MQILKDNYARLQATLKGLKDQVSNLLMVMVMNEQMNG